MQTPLMQETRYLGKLIVQAPAPACFND